MAQSRFEKIGTIYSRITGLYKSGAIKSEQVPLWYNIYEAFPPKYEPRWDRVAEEKQVVKILYPEDKVRAKFYRTYGEGEIVNLFDKETVPTSQKFVDKYMNIAESGQFSEQELWDRTVSQLENEGVDLTGNKNNSTVKSDKTEEKKSFKGMSFKDLFKEDK